MSVTEHVLQRTSCILAALEYWRKEKDNLELMHMRYVIRVCVLPVNVSVSCMRSTSERVRFAART